VDTGSASLGFSIDAVAIRPMIVATWNLENLFRPGSEYGPTSQEAYEGKLAALAEVITDIDPDVLAVQEVGSREAIQDLVDRLDGDWHVALSRFPDRREIRVGFISRLRFDDAEDIRDFPSAVVPVQIDDEGVTSAVTNRGVLRVRVTHQDRAVDLVTCHLKSKLLTFPGERFTARDEGERARFAAYALYQRAAEAVTVRSLGDHLLDGLGTDRAVVVLGDLNDEPLAGTTQILLGPPGSEIGTEGFERPDQGDRWRLWNLAPLIPQERRFTRIFRGRHELIDHVLVSHALAHRVTRVDTSSQTPPSITEFPWERRDARSSDHRPVCAEFDLT
jgi:endonuclease/exonuclease/phosphatase family metal-dependent hydrolase